MDNLGNKNITSNGYVVDRNKPVYVNHQRVDSRRISPSGYVYAGLQNDSNKKGNYDYTSTTPLPKSLKYSIGLIVVLVILDKMFAAVIPIMESLIVPSIIVVLVLTFLLPNMKNILVRNENEMKFSKQNKKYHVSWYVNFLISFIITYPLVSPVIYQWTEYVGDFFIGSESLVMNFLGLIVVALLYLIRFVIPMFIIPTIQIAMWKFASKIFERKSFKKVAEFYMY